MRPISKEKQQLEWTRKLDHLEVKNEHLRLEKEHFRKAAEEATRENSDLQIQLSAARCVTDRNLTLELHINTRIFISQGATDVSRSDS